MEKKYETIVKSHLDELCAITKSLYENPEIGLKEYKTSKLLVEYLEKQGFKMTYPYVMETGFLGVFDSGKKGPKIGFMCEYDALPAVGHGCGHNLICTTSIGAAIALKDDILTHGGSIYVFGTPAEENFGGKVQFKNAHAFDDIDIALMIHPGTYNGLGSKSTAIIPTKFEFHGISAHACNAYNGASALDAAVTTYQGINMLRQFMKQPSFIHGIFRDGGEAANVIPEYASLEYYFRSETYDYAEFLEKRAIEIAQSAAKMHNCTLTYSRYEEAYEDTKINYALADGLREAYEALGIEDIKPVKEIPGGSSDVGAPSKVCPTVQGNLKVADECVNMHSKEFAALTISEAGYKSILNGAQALAMLGYKYLTDEDYRKKVWDEFNK